MGRRLVFMTMASLDGFYEDADGNIGFGTIDAELHTHVNERVRGSDGLVFGRRTYELMVPYWAEAEDDESAAPEEREYSRIWKSKPKYVCSRTLSEVAEGHELLPDAAEGVARLKEGEGAHLLVGNADVVASLSAAGLLDGVELYVFPVVLGGGKPIARAFRNAGRLSLTETHRFASGTVYVRYEFA